MEQSFYQKHPNVVDYGVAVGAPLLAGSLSFFLFRALGRSASDI